MDGPAIIWANGQKSWFLFDERHNFFGPEAIYPDRNDEDYALYGIHISKQIFETVTKSKNLIEITIKLLKSDRRFHDKIQHIYKTLVAYGVDQKAIESIALIDLF